MRLLIAQIIFAQLITSSLALFTSTSSSQKYYQKSVDDSSSSSKSEALYLDGQQILDEWDEDEILNGNQFNEYGANTNEPKILSSSSATETSHMQDAKQLAKERLALALEKDDTTKANDPRHLLSTRIKGRRLHLRGGVCVTASKAFPAVDGGSTSASNPIDTSATYQAGSQDFINFFTCSYHYTGSSFDGCMGGSSQSVQLTFGITAVDTTKAPANTELLWNRCSSQSNCLQTWPNAGSSGYMWSRTNDVIGNRANRAGNSYTYYHQMGSRNANSRATSRCSNKGPYCNYWHHTNFNNIALNKGSWQNMNNAGASGTHDSVMVNPARQPTKYWSASGSSGAVSKNQAGGLDIDMIYRDYGAGWYRATIGGFGCETDTDTTWFRIKKGGCTPGQKCSTGTGLINGMVACTGSCINCVAGQYSTDGAACLLCPAGRSGSGTSATTLSSCSNCGHGYGSAAGASSCSTCAAGKYSSSGQPCSSCAVGQMSSAGVRYCSTCSGGYYCRRFNLLFGRNTRQFTHAHFLSPLFIYSLDLFLLSCLVLYLLLPPTSSLSVFL